MAGSAVLNDHDLPKCPRCGNGGPAQCACWCEQCKSFVLYCECADSDRDEQSESPGSPPARAPGPSQQPSREEDRGESRSPNREDGQAAACTNDTPTHHPHGATVGPNNETAVGSGAGHSGQHPRGDAATGGGAAAATDAAATVEPLGQAGGPSRPSPMTARVAGPTDRRGAGTRSHTSRPGCRMGRAWTAARIRATAGHHAQQRRENGDFQVAGPASCRAEWVTSVRER